MWPVLAPTTMHQRRFPGADHPPERTSAATRSGVSEHAGVRESTTAEKESGSPVCRAEESDRPAPLASAEIEVCAGAVLSGCNGAKPETARAIPEQQTCNETADSLEY